MTDIFGRVISANTMRAAVRAKVQAGVSREAICWLILAYAPADVSHDRTEGGVPRLPVEVILPEKRLAFLDALFRLSGAPIEAHPSPAK